MLVDDVIIRVKAGDGGSGAVAFNKNMMSLGPAGGSGGRGGSVYLQGVADIGALRHFMGKKEWHAPDGDNGRGQFVDGPDGEDIILKVPVGTVVHNLVNGTDHEVTKIDEKLLVAQGGKGGKGNFHFRSSTNTSPRQSQSGLPGEKFTLRLELKLIADIGFVGLPNVGKSSLLNELTNAKSKVGNYAFTTLEPNLGAYYELILADIPGLIEGASSGRGLGVKFLRHVERTRVLFHFIAADSETPWEDYTTIRSELGKYSPELLKKKEYVFLSKSDALKPADLKKAVVLLKKHGITPVAISIVSDSGLSGVKKILNAIIKEKHAFSSRRR